MLLLATLLFATLFLYAVTRWFTVTSDLVDDARQARMKRAIDWNR